MDQTLITIEPSNSESENKVCVFSHQDGEIFFLLTPNEKINKKGVSQEVAQLLESFLRSTAISEDPMILEETLRKFDHHLALSSLPGEYSVIVVYICPTYVVGVSFGNSECWCFNDSLPQLEWSVHQRRKPFLGSGRSMPVGFGPFARKGRLLIASDGLFGFTYMNQIRPIMQKSKFEDLPKKLLELVRLNSGRFQQDVSMLVHRFS